MIEKEPSKGLIKNLSSEDTKKETGNTEAKNIKQERE